MKEALKFLGVVFACVVFSMVFEHMVACESTADLCALSRSIQ